MEQEILRHKGIMTTPSFLSGSAETQNKDFGHKLIKAEQSH